MAEYGLMPSLSGYGIKPKQAYDFGYNPTFESPELYNYAPVREAVAVPTTFMDQLGGAMSGINQRLQDWGVIGGKDAQGNTFNGWGGLALGAAQGIGNLYMGMKQYGLMQDQLNFSKDAFNKNYAVQKNLTNSQLADRQDRRNAEGLMPGTMSTADYMARYGVK